MRSAAERMGLKLGGEWKEGAAREDGQVEVEEVLVGEDLVGDEADLRFGLFFAAGEGVELLLAGRSIWTTLCM